MAVSCKPLQLDRIGGRVGRGSEPMEEDTEASSRAAAARLAPGAEIYNAASNTMLRLDDWPYPR